MENTEIMERNNDEFIGGFYTSIDTTNEENAKMLFNATDNCDVVINDIIGQKIKVADVALQTFIDGEGKERFKSILFDDEGKSYVTMSKTFFNTLKKLLSIFGTPDTWNEPKEITVGKKTINGKTKGAYVLTFTI